MPSVAPSSFIAEPLASLFGKKEPWSILTPPKVELVFMYVRLSRIEEGSVLAEFGEAYERYGNETPACRG